MDAAGTSRWFESAETFEPGRLARFAVALGIALLGLAGFVLVGRRLSSVLVAPPALALAIVGLLLAAAGLAVRWMLGPRMFGAATARGRAWLAVYTLPSVVSLLWLAALWLPETSGMGLVLLLGPVLLAEGFAWGRLARQDAAAPASSRMSQAGRVVTATAMIPVATAADVSAPLPSATTAQAETEAMIEMEMPAEGPLTGAAMGNVLEAACDPEVERDAELAETIERDKDMLGQQTRRRDAEAGDVVEGWVRVDFAAGQRHATVHVAICPAMRVIPTCYAETSEGFDASVKVTQAMSYGVRLEVKLAEPAEEAASVIVDYSILERAVADDV